MKKQFLRAIWAIIGVIVLLVFIPSLNDKDLGRTSAAASTKRTLERTPEHQVVFISDPLGAEVHIDGTTYSERRTPFTMTLPQGVHTYRVGYGDTEVEYDIYRPYEGRLNVKNPETVNVKLSQYTRKEIAARDAREAEEARAAEAGAADVASIVPSPNVSVPIDHNIYDGMNSLLEENEYDKCVGEPHFFMSSTPSSVASYLDSLKENGYNYEPLFQVGDNLNINTITLARITGNGANVYSMFIVRDGSGLMLCDAS